MNQPTMMELIEEAVENPTMRMYLDAGDTTSEGVVEWEADNLNFVAELHNALCSNGYSSASPICQSIDDACFVWDEEASIPKENLCMVVGQGHRHSEEDWAKRLEWALQFLYEDLEYSVQARIQQ